MTSCAQDLDPRDLQPLGPSIAAAVNERLSAWGRWARVGWAPDRVRSCLAGHYRPPAVFDEPGEARWHMTDAEALVVDRAVRGLPRRQRRAVVRYYVLGMSAMDIAQSPPRCSVRTVYYHLEQARRALAHNIL